MTTATQMRSKSSSTLPVATQAVSPVSSERAFAPEIAILADPRGAQAEAVRALRTHVIAQHIHEGRRALAVCAASAGVGCTFVASNLAVALSQTGIKTLLIDADLRQPGVDRLVYGHDTTVGLSQYLSSNDMPFGEAIQSEILPNFSVLYAGGKVDNPQELLASHRFHDLMDICLRDYDVTIVDTPPANTCADARRISNVIGYSLVVARLNHSLIEDVKALVSELESDRAVVIGTVLNES